MTKGKLTCKLLKDIRRQIAEANNIELITSECQYLGDCLGTCPKCEAEVRYLEQQLARKRIAGKAITILGISAGIISINACSSFQTLPTKAKVSETELDMGKDALNTVKEKKAAIPQSTMKESSQKYVETNIWNGEFSPSHVTYPEGEKELFEYIKREISYPNDLYPDSTIVKIPVNIIIQKDRVSVADIGCKDSTLVKEVEKIIMQMPRWSPAMPNKEPKTRSLSYNMHFTIYNSPIKSNQKGIIPMNETNPEFPGGIKSLLTHLKGNIQMNRPIYQGETNTQAHVIVRFTIEKDGSITDPEVVRSVDPYIDKEALKVVSQLPRWKPATLRGKAIAFRYTVPVTIKLVYQ